MAKTVVKILLDIIYPEAPNPELPNLPQESPTRVSEELEKVIRDGCVEKGYKHTIFYESRFCDYGFVLEEI